jgi:hypothetical protein
METKTLKIKRVFAWTIYDHLRKVAPKDYPTTAEIKSTLSEILPILKPSVEAYISVLKRAEELQEKVVAFGKLEGEEKKTKDAETQKIIDALNEEWKNYNKKEGNEIIDIAISDEGLKTLKAQFEREGWGKTWIASVEEFGELLEAFTSVNK